MTSVVASGSFKDPELHENLPGGWKRRCVRRRTVGAKTEGKWDVYITAPDGKRLRSTIEILRHLEENRRYNINPVEINLEVSSRITGQPITDQSNQVKKLREGMDAMEANGGKLPEEFALKKGRAPGSTGGPSSQPVDRIRNSGERWASGQNKKMREEEAEFEAKRAREELRSMKSQLEEAVKPSEPKWPFKEKQINYLKKQFAKVPYPTPNQVLFLARQLKSEVSDVRRWLTYQRSTSGEAVTTWKKDGDKDIKRYESSPKRDKSEKKSQSGGGIQYDSSGDSSPERRRKNEEKPKSSSKPSIQYESSGDSSPDRRSKSKMGPKSKVMGPKSKVDGKSDEDEDGSPRLRTGPTESRTDPAKAKKSKSSIQYESSGDSSPESPKTARVDPPAAVPNTFAQEKGDDDDDWGDVREDFLAFE